MLTPPAMLLNAFVVAVRSHRGPVMRVAMIISIMLSCVGHPNTLHTAWSQDGDRPDASGDAKPPRDAKIPRDAKVPRDATENQSPPNNSAPDNSASNNPAPTFELSDEVRDAVLPLFRRVNRADVTRVTATMLFDTLVSGRTIDSTRSTFQIASTDEGKYTIYLRQPDQRTRLYSDSKDSRVALAPDAYVDLPETLSNQQVVIRPPVILGPYPEPVLALSMAGVDPAVTFLGGMRSVQVLDRMKFDDKIPAVHLRGVQTDRIVWDFWISEDDDPRPLRLLIDMTPMLIASQKVPVPAGYSQQIRYDFDTFRTDGTLKSDLFMYKPSAKAKRYDSVQQYLQTVAAKIREENRNASDAESNQPGPSDEPSTPKTEPDDDDSATNPTHRLNGKYAPNFRALDLAGGIVDTRTIRGRVRVIDFWATWCEPCLEAMPMIRSVTDRYGNDKVVLLSVNTGESKQRVTAFYRRNRIRTPTLLDPDGKIADGFDAQRIPQTYVVGADGVVTAVLTGYSQPKDSARRLSDAIDAALAKGKG